VIQEGENSNVRITEKIVSFLNCQTTGSTGGTAIATVTPVLEDVGLKLGVQIDKIDDNGFVTLQVVPDLSAPVTQQDLGPCVAGGARQVVTLTQNRVTNSGRVRLRDGQTLVLSGVIQDFQRTQNVKFPILGDLPIFGSLFRSTENTRERREIVVVLTPRIVDDTDLARFGYNTGQMLPR
jgi:type IV pilus assembly protein PilQ